MVKRIFLIGSVLLGFYVIPMQGYPEGDSDILHVAQMPRMPKVFTITIHGSFDGSNTVTWLDPKELRVGRGETVVWINESQADIRIKIGGDSPCEEVPKKSLGWRLAPNRCFETKDVLEPKEALSIRFRDIGRYFYEIEYVGKNRIEKGVAHVRTEDR
jgi:hypothetical protein